jgi:hypothetical protein
MLSAPARARAALALQQKAIVGFPVTGVSDVVQIDPKGAGAHRLAVLNEHYLLGLQWSPERNVYDQIFFIQGFFEFGRLMVADVNGDSRNDLLVYSGYQSKQITAYDSGSGALLKTFAIPGISQFVPRPVITQDTDGVAGDEMIIRDGGTSAYKADVRLWHSNLSATLLLPSRAAATSGEIFLTTPVEVIVLNARTGQEKRRLAVSCLQASVGQSSTDNHPQIACSTPAGMQLVDGLTGAVRWTRPSGTVTDLAMFDVNGDGTDDVLTRFQPAPLEEAITVLNGSTGVPLKGTIPVTGSGPVIGITSGCEPTAVVAVDGNGGFEGAHALWLLDGLTLDRISTYTLDSYGSTGFAVADLDGDGRNELAVAHDGKVSTMRMEPRSMIDTVATSASCCSFRGMAAAQLDADAASEYVVAQVCGAGYLGCLTAWDPGKPAPLWTSTMDDGEVPFNVTVADVDGDGAADVLSTSFAVHSGAKGQFVYAFRGRDGTPLWRSTNFPNPTGRLRVADVEGTGTPQVLALSGSVGILRLKRSSGTVSGFYEFNGGTAFTTYKRDGDARAKVLAVAGDRLFVLDGGQVETEVHGADIKSIREIEVGDIDGDGVPEIVAAQSAGDSNSYRLQVRSLDTLALLWTSEDFLSIANFGQTAQLTLQDVDNDGVTDVVFLSSLAVRVFKSEALPAGTTPPAFDAAAAISAHAQVRAACCAAVYLRWDHARAGTSPPLQYRVYRAGSGGESEILLATTPRNELVDLNAGGGAGGYRYSVEVVDGAGHASPGRLTADVLIGKGGRCHRPAGKP